MMKVMEKADFRVLMIPHVNAAPSRNQVPDQARQVDVIHVVWKTLTNNINDTKMLRSLLCWCLG